MNRRCFSNGYTRNSILTKILGKWAVVQGGLSYTGVGLFTGAIIHGGLSYTGGYNIRGSIVDGIFSNCYTIFCKKKFKRLDQDQGDSLRRLPFTEEGGQMFTRRFSNCYTKHSILTKIL